MNFGNHVFTRKIGISRVLEKYWVGGGGEKRKTHIFTRKLKPKYKDKVALVQFN
jgi:hypothetical protein